MIKGLYFILVLFLLVVSLELFSHFLDQYDLTEGELPARQTKSSIMRANYAKTQSIKNAKK